jgi:hypothetical protein
LVRDLDAKIQKAAEYQEGGEHINREPIFGQFRFHLTNLLIPIFLRLFLRFSRKGLHGSHEINM